jgi:hypothetical protein
MSVTDPDVPDPLNDPRTTQADPGALGQGADLASAGDDAVTAGEDEPTGDDDTGPDDAGTRAGRDPADDAGGGDVTGGAFSNAP